MQKATAAGLVLFLSGTLLPVLFRGIPYHRHRGFPAFTRSGMYHARYSGTGSNPTVARLPRSKRAFLKG